MFPKKSHLYEKVLQQFKWLTDLYALDYFVESHWKRLPLSWQNHFDHCICDASKSHAGIVELVDSLLSSNKCYYSTKCGPFPLSLITLKQCVKILAFRRDTISNRGQIERQIFGNCILFQNAPLTDLSKVLPIQLKTNIKEKKLHEIGRIYDLLDVILQRLSVDADYWETEWRIIDIGSGVGHLSRIISFLLNCDIETIEGNDNFVKKSVKMDHKFNKFMKGNVQNYKNSQINYECLLASEWRPPHRRLALIEAEHQIIQIEPQNSIDQKIILVGLHTCGDLTPTILRNFVSNNNAKVLVNLGCCYHKLNNGKDKYFCDIYDDLASISSSSLKGFPLSQEFSSFKISYASRELACFSVKYFLQKLRQTINAKVLIVNVYRAVLEWLIVGCPALDAPVSDLSPQLRHRGLRGVKNAEKMEFWQYVNETLRFHPKLLLEIAAKKSEKSVKDRLNKLLDSESERIVLIYALRQIIAPLIETTIIEDRHAFLTEKFKIENTTVLPIFSGELSPRNLALVSIKP